MELGIYFDMRNPPQWAKPPAQKYGETLELIEEAEAKGMDYVWFSEHHFFEDGYLPQTLTMAAAAAARTKRIRIGAAIVLAALRPALQIAEEAAIVDIISNGRLELGLGAGYVISEFEAFGVDIEDRYKLCDARVGEIRELFSGKLTPKPVQDPLPIWLGYMGPKGAKRAGKIGCGLLHAGNKDPYLEGLADGGHDPSSAEMSGLIWLLVSEDPERAYEKVIPHALYQLNSYALAMAEGRAMSPQLLTEEDFKKRGRKSSSSMEGLSMIQVLTPDEAIAHIKEATAGLPVKEVHAWGDIAGMPEELVHENLRLMTDKVRPGIENFQP